MKSLLLCLVTVAAAVAMPDPFRVAKSRGLPERIVGGEDAKECQFFYQCAVVWNGYFICGGSLIYPNYVLTAAHCVEGYTSPQDKYHIICGRYKLFESSQNENISEVNSVTYHPGYDPKTVDYDIAVMKLASPFKLTDCVNTIEMATTSPESGTPCTISGYGSTKEGNNTLPPTLQWTEVPFVSTNDCKKIYPGNSITDRMNCAGGSGKDSCQGDSGGPMVSGGKQVGIVSWGYGCGREGQPGVYSDVSNLHDWIIANTQ